MYSWTTRTREWLSQFRHVARFLKFLSQPHLLIPFGDMKHYLATKLTKQSSESPNSEKQQENHGVCTFLTSFDHGFHRPKCWESMDGNPRLVRLKAQRWPHIASASVLHFGHKIGRKMLQNWYMNVEWMCNTAREIEAATLPEWLLQPLWQSG